MRSEMKKELKRLLSLTLAGAALWSASYSVFADETPDTPARETEADAFPALWADGNAQVDSKDKNAFDVIKWFAYEDRGKNAVNVGSTKSNNYYLFMPTTADLSALTVWHSFESDPTVNGEFIKSGEMTSVFSKPGEYQMIADGEEYKVTVMQSRYIGSMYITTESGNLEYVHKSKTNKEAGTIAVFEANGTQDYNGDLDYIKGRGNTTWGFAKRPYNIKLDKKAPLLGMDASKKWCLLANAQDHTMLRNRIAFDLADELGLPYSPDSQFADLYLNGEYAGVYQVSEKVEEGKNNLVKINDLSDATEKVNDKKLDTYEKIKDGTGNGSLKYSDITNDPEDITGGYLLEFEMGDKKYDEEDSGFITNRGQRIVIKGPENATKAQAEYISSFYQDAEDALYSYDGYNSKGKHYSEYIDIEDAALYYLIEEFSLNIDAGATSCFFFKDSDKNGDGKLHASPVWDFDVAFGNLDSEFDGEGHRLNDPRAIYVENRDNWEISDLCILARLNTHKDFIDTVYRLYEEKFRPALKILNDMSDKEGEHLRSLTQYREELEPSANMNFARWRITDNLLVSKAGKKFYMQFDYLKDFIENRTEFFDEYYSDREVSDNLTVYFYDTNEWNDIYVYCYNGTETMDYPGVKMEPCENDFGIALYKTDLGALGIKEDGYARLIFSDGKDNTSKDVKAVNNRVTYCGSYEEADSDGNTVVYKYTGSFEYPDTEGYKVYFIIGDVDDDGAITSNDALTVLRFSAEAEKPYDYKQFICSLVDGDDSITSADALFILRYSLGYRDEQASNIATESYYYSENNE